jgi:hypothetical protein
MPTLNLQQHKHRGTKNVQAHHRWHEGADSTFVSMLTYIHNTVFDHASKHSHQ